MNSIRNINSFHSLLDNFHYGMFSTYNPSGELHIRPMLVAALEENCDLWLLTNEQSAKSEEIHQTPHVALSFQHDPMLYVVVYGTAELIRDPQRIYEVWTDEYQTWFPEGPRDKQLTLIKITTEWGEFWDHSATEAAQHVYRIENQELRRVPPTARGESHARVHLR
jgi:general stress protein 26